MQKEFAASELILSEVLFEVRKAKRNKEFIILIQYGYGSRSLGRITRELKGYKYLTVNKHSDDGGVPLFRSLIHCMFDNNLNTKKLNLSSIRSIKVCGVNTSACVMKTVRTLSYLRFSVKVLSRACANNFDKYDDVRNQLSHRGALKRMAKWKNVQVI